MAGIGFELRRMAGGDSYSSVARAYTYAGIISSGPWIISILSIVVLTLFLSPLLTGHQLDFFSASITHVYAFSLILVGPIQLVLTRYVADQFSFKTQHKVFPSFIVSLAMTGALAAVVGIVFFGFLVDATLLHRISATALMVYVSCIFITANYLTALRGYKVVVFGFFVGYVVSCLLAYGLTQAYGADAGHPVLGFAIGHALLLLILVYSVHREFGSNIEPSWEVLGYFRKFPSLVLCGLFYNLGIWADKLMFWWFSDQHQKISGLLYASPQYDVAIYLSLLSIVPGMAVFFLRLETDFADKYERFFERIENHQSLSSIVEAKGEIVEALRSGFTQLFKVQGVVTVLLVIFADQLTQYMSIGSIQLGILRVTLFGAFLLICFLSLLTVLFYFDDRRGALFCTAIFAIGNAGLSIPTLLASEAWYGFGFVVAAAVAMAVAAMRVNHRVENLESYIFRGQ